MYARYRGRCVGPQELKNNAADYILCSSFWDANELIEVDPQPGAVYIYSSSEAFDEEQRFDIRSLNNWLELFQMRPVGIPAVDTGRVPEGEKGFHASGHITGPDLLELIRTIDPQFVIPVHTENTEFFRRNIEPRKLRIATKENPLSF